MVDVAPWYTRDDYQRIREIMDDGDKLPATFDQWEATAKRQMASAKTMGFTLKPVILNSDEFIAFCDRKKIPRNSQSRAKFGIERGLAEGMN